MATKHVAVRLDEQTLARVDALIPALSTPWRKAKRSDVLRALIAAGLDVGAPRRGGRGGSAHDGGAAESPGAPAPPGTRPRR